MISGRTMKAVWARLRPAAMMTRSSAPLMFAVSIDVADCISTSISLATRALMAMSPWMNLMLTVRWFCSKALTASAIHSGEWAPDVAT